MTAPGVSINTKWILFILAGFLGLALAAGAWIWFRRPDLALAGVYRIYVLRSGLHDEVVDAPGHKFLVYTGGKMNATPVLMIHGFGDSRISFGQAAQFLSPHLRLVLPDVPGFGDTPEDPAVNHGISTQVAAMKSLLDAMGIQRVSLVGNSMGGHISAAFTLTHPEMVEKLVVLNPAGLRVDDPNPYSDAAAPLESDADFDAYMDKLFFKRPWIPAPFRKDFITKANARFAWLNRIRGEIRGDKDYILNDRIAGISVPTLILWGRHDRIISPVHAPIWHEKIKNSRMEIWEDAGHSPQYEYPERTANLLLEFLR